MSLDHVLLSLVPGTGVSDPVYLLLGRRTDRASR